MDGNPTGDILLTLSGSSYDPVTRTAELNLSYPGAYTYFPDKLSRGELVAKVPEHGKMLIVFNEELTFATIIPVTGNGEVAALTADPRVVDYTMHLEGDGHWVRESSYLGVRVADYQLRRVVRRDGTREAAYADYLKFAQPTSKIGYRIK